MPVEYPVGTRLRCLGLADFPFYSRMKGKEATVFIKERREYGVRFDDYNYMSETDYHHFDSFEWEVISEPKLEGLIGFLRKHEGKS